jgi:hypothetical protein
MPDAMASISRCDSSAVVVSAVPASSSRAIFAIIAPVSQLPGDRMDSYELDASILASSNLAMAHP